MNQLIEIQLSDNMSPGEVRSKDIAEVISSLEDMIASVVIRDHPELSKDNIIIGLSDISKGSLNLAFVPHLIPLTIPAVKEIIFSIAHDIYDSLPVNAVASLKRIIRLTERHNCEAKISAKDGETVLEAIIKPQTEISEKIYLNGETTLYGEIKRVGGDEPAVLFKPVNGRSVFCRTTKDLAKKAGNYLYAQVGLSGIAEWDTETYEIKSFRIVSITDYKKTNITDAFRELSECIGDWADSIPDVNRYTDNIRYGEA